MKLLPFEGFVDGRAKVAISLRKPQDFRAEVTLDQLQMNPRKSQALKLGVQPQDVVLKNTKPVVAIITAKEVRIQSAQFAARDTSLEATGGIPFDPQSPADLAVRGSVNLAILQLYNSDLLARGNATVQATVRGSLRDPQMNGRMELKNASLYLADLPNGIDNAEGSIVFDRNRATIEKLTAETGGGKIFFAGFVELRDILTYRLQAEAQQVRVRYPEDVSTTFNARLALNGTSDASTLSGSITLNRAAFNPRSDLGGLMALATKTRARARVAQRVSARHAVRRAHRKRAELRISNFADARRRSRGRPPPARLAHPPRAARLDLGKSGRNSGVRQPLHRRSRRHPLSQSGENRTHLRYGPRNQGPRHHRQHQLLRHDAEAQRELQFGSAACSLAKSSHCSRSAAIPRI